MSFALVHVRWIVYQFSYECLARGAAALLERRVEGELQREVEIEEGVLRVGRSSVLVQTLDAGF